MAEKRKNIDNLFREHLTGHKVPAPEGAWERLHAELAPAGRKKAFLIYVRVAAAVVLLLLAFGAGYFLSNYHTDKSLPVASETTPSVTTPDKSASSGSESHATPSPATVKHADEPVSLAETTTKAEQNQGSSGDKISVPKQELMQPEHEKTGYIAAADNIAEKPETTKDNREPAPVTSPEKEQTGNAVAVARENETRAVTETVTEVINETTAAAIKSPQKMPEELEQMSPEMLHKLLVEGDDQGGELLAEKQKQPVRGWSMGGQIYPMYSYRSLGGQSLQTPDENVDKSYLNDVENGLSTIGGGISLAYHFNERLSLGSGLFLSRIGQENSDVIAYDSPGTGYIYKLATSSGTVSINPTKFEKVMIRQLDNSKDSLPGDYLVNGTFVQNLDYMEVPLVLNYKVLNKRFSIQVSGGLSPGILVNNRSYFNIDNEKIQTGITENIKPMIYNSVVGIGMGYDISKKVSVNLSPTFKYSLSPVNSGGSLNYHPYSISLFTGISYKL